MILRKVKRPALSLLVALLLLFAGGPVWAASQTGSGGNGLRISPVRIDMVIKPGGSKQVAINVTNVTSSKATLQVIVNDFTASSDESGKPAIILTPNKQAPTHSLKRYVLPVPNFTLNPGQQKTIKAVVKIPSDAAGGGYYGVIRFAPASTNSGTKNVTLAGSVGPLVLVKVPGNITENLSIASFDIRKADNPGKLFFTNKSLAATVRFQNQGNVQEEPFGKVVLRNSSGKMLSEYEVNNTDPRGNVLPDSIRKFTIPLKNVGSFGKYNIEGNFGYGANGQLLSAKTTFYVVPLFMAILVAVLILLILFAIFILPRVVRSYNRKVIRRASRRQ